MSNSRLDREVMSSHSFDAIATDSCLYGPRSQTVRVDVTVLDVNDNSPQFHQNIYSADISLDLPVGGHVTTVSATDRDIGVNARLNYSLADTNFQVCDFSRLTFITYLSLDIPSDQVLLTHSRTDNDQSQ